MTHEVTLSVANTATASETIIEYALNTLNISFFTTVYLGKRLALANDNILNLNVYAIDLSRNNTIKITFEWE